MIYFLFHLNAWYDTLLGPKGLINVVLNLLADINNVHYIIDGDTSLCDVGG